MNLNFILDNKNGFQFTNSTFNSLFESNIKQISSWWSNFEGIGCFKILVLVLRFFDFFILVYSKKELLQNAEDSNATVVRFYIDLNQYPTEHLLHPDLKMFQGPSLMAFNNTRFSENDFNSIKTIEKSEKHDKPNKIGKFGLGFNSVYHLTGKFNISIF